jgi:hypothetical protein
MKRRLSSRQTLAVKIVIPILCLIGLGASLSETVRGSHTEAGGALPWPVFVIGLVAIGYLLWHSIRLKTVSVDGRFLYVSN